MAHGYAMLSADGPADVDVEWHNATRPFNLVIKTEPLSSVIHMSRPAVDAVVLGLVGLLTHDDRAATGELLDRLVAIVAGES